MTIEFRHVVIGNILIILWALAEFFKDFFLSHLFLIDGFLSNLFLIDGFLSHLFLIDGFLSCFFNNIRIVKSGVFTGVCGIIYNFFVDYFFRISIRRVG